MSPMRMTVVAVTLTLAVSACGGSSSEPAADDVLDGEIVLGDDVTVDEAAVTTATPAPADDGAAGAAESGGAGDDSAGFETTDDTIPQTEDDSQAAQVDNLFSAMRIFNECLEDEGTTFLGDPRGAEEGSPAADPAYLESLQKCAALSNIQEAFQGFQEAQDNLTQEEILERNEGLLVWRDCMEGRGWVIGDLVADERGLLTPGDLTPPEGEDALGSDDLGECASETIDDTTDDDETVDGSE